MGVDGTPTYAIQTLEFSGCSEVVPLYPIVDQGERDYERDEGGSRCRNDH
jgi:hypothetical protein